MQAHPQHQPPPTFHTNTITYPPHSCSCPQCQFRLCLSLTPIVFSWWIDTVPVSAIFINSADQDCKCNFIIICPQETSHGVIEDTTRWCCVRFEESQLLSVALLPVAY